jgi:uncharacterized protein YxeA
MKMIKRISESLEYPLELDVTSSKTTVYVRENIKSKTQDNNGEKSTVYIFDEFQYTKEEYLELLVKKNKANLDYLSIMTGVDLDV